MVRRDVPDVRLIELARNEGACAKNHALPVAAGEFVFFLDDDSCPLGDTVPRAAAKMAADAALGIAGCRAVLPDGREESSAFANVFIGCGAMVRRRPLIDAGGLPTDFFMCAEEYDTSFRMIAAGYTVRTFGDLAVRHEKSPVARQSDRAARLDVRNNLLAFTRRFPSPWAGIFAREFIWRYWRLARHARRTRPFLRGLAAGLAKVAAARLTGRRRYPADVLDRLIGHDRVERWLAGEQRRRGLRRVLLADVGKGIYVYWRACRRLGIEIAAVAENGPPWQGRRYRGIPILPDAVCRPLGADAVVLTNESPAHAPGRLAVLKTAFDVPVLHA
jgi:GT2 family glycosyltransferase